MYAFLKGIVDYISESTVDIDVSGVGYEVGISAATASRMPSVGSEVKIYTYTYMREDVIALYGFLRRDELELFKLLITVSGVGPKAGLSLLSSLSADDLRYAVLSGDVKLISSAPGIGRKTAERLILELKGKVSEVSAEMTAVSAGQSSENTVGDDASDAVDALSALGYTRAEAVRAVKAAAAQGISGTEELLRAALRQIH